MQAPKSRPGSLELPQKKSSLPAPRTARRVKTGGTDSDQKTKTIPKTQIPKVVADRSSPRIPLNEIQKKRTGRIPELESQISELQEELKKVKEELNRSEALKKEAQKTKQLLMELNASEDSRIDELLQLSQERDKTWQSELEAMQRQHGLDSSALSSAIHEVQKLKSKLFESESSSSMEVEKMKEEMNLARQEIIQLKSAVEVAETRHQETEAVKSREAELAKAEIEGLRKQVMDKKKEDEFTEDLKRVEFDLIDTRENLMKKEMELQNLKSEMEKKVETIDTAAMEAELKRVKVQCEQWRKAAETAVSILNSDEERTDYTENGNMLMKFVCAAQEKPQVRTMLCPRLPRK